MGKISKASHIPWEPSEKKNSTINPIYLGNLKTELLILIIACDNHPTQNGIA